jgi:hypothetical protein
MLGPGCITPIRPPFVKAQIFPKTRECACPICLEGSRENALTSFHKRLVRRNGSSVPNTYRGSTVSIFLRVGRSCNNACQLWHKISWLPPLEKVFVMALRLPDVPGSREGACMSITMWSRRSARPSARGKRNGYTIEVAARSSPATLGLAPIPRGRGRRPGNGVYVPASTLRGCRVPDRRATINHGPDVRPA